MSLYVLDTDHASLLQRGHQQVAPKIAAKQKAHEIAVTIAGPSPGLQTEDWSS